MGRFAGSGLDPSAAARGLAALYRLPQKYLCKTKSDHLFLRWPLLFCLLQAFNHICHDLRRGLNVLGDAELLDNEHLIAALVGVVAHGAQDDAGHAVAARDLADRRALHFDAVGVALFLNRLFRLGVADEGVARGDLACDGLHAAGSAGVQRGLHQRGIAVVLGLERCALGDHAQLGIVVDDGLTDADVADADFAGHIARNAAENQLINAVFCAQHLHGGRGVCLAHARAADDDLLALQRAAVVLDPGVVLFGHVLQPCAQLVDFVGHSAHNANNHGQTSVKR